MRWSRTLRAGIGVLALSCAAVPGFAGVQHSSVVSDNPADWVPHVDDGKVQSSVTVGGTTVAVGNFTSVREQGAATSTARTDIFAFDSSGDITSFAPQVGGAEIFDVVSAGDGQTVYIGGTFTEVNGVKRSRVARLNVNTGELVSTFRGPSINRKVNSLHLANGRLYVGGWFDTVGGQPQTSLVALDPTTGANTGHLNLRFSDTWNGGVVGIDEFTMTPDGSKLVAIGNFRNVEAQPRAQIVMVDTSGATAALDSWATDRFDFGCHTGFDTYMWGVDFAPDGSYFVVGTTGAYSGGVNSGTLCDSVSRWETDRSGGGQQPTWVDYMGGDTVTEVEATNHAVYVGGHFRWANNPYAGDAVGPGAVRRMGLAAFDTRNGLPLSWNPGRARGWGVWGFESSPQGLWVGHDTERIGGELRGRLALMPVAGGASLPADNTGALPGQAYLLGKRPELTGLSPVLYRVNAGGPELASGDGYMNWAGDEAGAPSPLNSSGSNTAAWTEPTSRTADVPADTPQEVFSTERWDPNGDPAMQWDFPVDAGLPLEVRFYLSNGYGGTSSPGQRVFDVSVDGSVVLDDYDIAADAGHLTGTMKSFDISSDGNVDIDFGHVTENPLVNAIEIVRTDIAPPQQVDDDNVIRNDLSESGASGSTAVANGGVDWSSVRGAFMVDGRLYTGWSDGTFTWRSYNGSSFGSARTVDLHGLTAFASELPGVRAMWFDRTNGRMYFTLNGVNTLFYRYFTPESNTVGAVRFTAPNSGAIDWRRVSGGFVANGRLYVSTVDGSLQSLQWQDGAASGAPQTMSGPAVDGVDWNTRSLFLYAG